jgi:hypothetical protein
MGYSTIIFEHSHSTRETFWRHIASERSLVIEVEGGCVDYVSADVVFFILLYFAFHFILLYLYHFKIYFFIYFPFFLLASIFLSHVTYQNIDFMKLYVHLLGVFSICQSYITYQNIWLCFTLVIICAFVMCILHLCGSHTKHLVFVKNNMCICNLSNAFVCYITYKEIFGFA